MTTNLKGSFWHTFGAVIISVTVFFLLIYLVAPVFEYLLNLFGKYFVPSRFGGGAESEHPGILTMLVRGVLVSGLSAYAAMLSAFYFFFSANPKVVGGVFGAVVLLWGAVFVVAGIMTKHYLEPIVLFGSGILPPCLIAYWAWQGDFGS